jgi:mycofactocin precursor
VTAGGTASLGGHVERTAGGKGAVIVPDRLGGGTGTASAVVGKGNVMAEIGPAQTVRPVSERESGAEPGALGASVDDGVEELLVEEVSIDGMCGVY